MLLHWILEEHYRNAANCTNCCLYFSYAHIYFVQRSPDTMCRTILRLASWCRRATEGVPLPTQTWTMSAADPTPSSPFASSRSRVHLPSAECHLPPCLYIFADSCRSLKLSSPYLYYPVSFLHFLCMLGCLGNDTRISLWFYYAWVILHNAAGVTFESS